MSALVIANGLGCWTTLRPYTIPAAPALMSAAVERSDRPNPELGEAAALAGR